MNATLQPVPVLRLTSSVVMIGNLFSACTKTQLFALGAHAVRLRSPSNDVHTCWSALVRRRAEECCIRPNPLGGRLFRRQATAAIRVQTDRYALGWRRHPGIRNRWPRGKPEFPCRH